MGMRPVGGLIIRETFIHVSRGFTLEAEDYINKPIRPNKLLARIERALKKWAVKHREVLGKWNRID